MRSTSSPLAVSMMMGTDSPAARRRRQTGKAVLAGQHEIQHDQTRAVALQLAVEVARVGQRGDLEALLAEIAGEKVAQPHIVVDDENLGGAVGAVMSLIKRVRAVNCRDATVNDCNDGGAGQRPVAIAGSARRNARPQSGSNVASPQASGWAPAPRALPQHLLLEKETIYEYPALQVGPA